MSGEKAEERWRPILGVDAILTSVINLLIEPNINSPANVDAGVSLLVYKFSFSDLI